MDARIAKQRTLLVLDHPFIGSLALRLEVREDPSCKTFWTDGASLGYNPVYAAALTDLQIRGVLAHEVWHVAGGHCWRQGARDPEVWNEACDYVVNQIVDDAGLQLPPGVLIDVRFKGMSAEEVYGILMHEKRQTRKQPDDGEADAPQFGRKSGTQPSTSSVGTETEAAPSCGEVRQYAGPDKVAKEVEWKVAVLQAAKAAQACGKLGGALQAAVEQSVASVVDWRPLLHRFAQDAAPIDYTWALPDRRYLHLGMYLPSLNQPQVGDAVFVRDTSGSVWDETQAQFAAEILAVADAIRPRRLIVMDCDERVTQVQIFEQGDLVELAPLKGGGGTSFIDPFHRIAGEDIEPAFLVYLTDMEGTFPSEEPAYPVLWASTTPLKRARRAPFGETIEVVC